MELILPDPDGRIRPYCGEPNVGGNIFRSARVDVGEPQFFGIALHDVECAFVDIHGPHGAVSGLQGETERNGAPTATQIKEVPAWRRGRSVREKNLRSRVNAIGAENAAGGREFAGRPGQNCAERPQLDRTRRGCRKVVIVGHAEELTEIQKDRVNPMMEREEESRDEADPIDRVLAAADARAGGYAIFASRALALHADGSGGAESEGNPVGPESADGDQLERDERAALRRVGGLSTELADVSEVEYRQLRLENVVLVGIYPQGGLDEAENSLRELAALAETAGAVVLDGLLQRRSHPDASTFLGKGKAHELRDVVAALGADTVIADTELAPSQRRALEDVVKVKVIDRTAVILDIFSQHAKSREGKAQVELAQLEYLLPRLRGWGESMSRQAGGQVGAGVGMGSRGPGETKIELDRRRIRTRMARLRKQIKEFAPTREAKRANRTRNAVPSVAIAGYTNAGKSSLLNRITHAGALVENALFATLDTAVRRTETPDGFAYTLTDTVGFVRNLPHELVEAFRSTLEEVERADVIVHVVDSSHPDPASQLTTVRDVIGDIGARDVPEIVVFNKADLIDDGERLVLRGLEPNSVFVSARTGEGIDELLARISELIPRPDIRIEVLVPYERGDVISALHELGTVISTSYEEEGTRVVALVSPKQDSAMREFQTERSTATTLPKMTA